jgi:hypothetical protein
LIRQRRVSGLAAASTVTSDGPEMFSDKRLRQGNPRAQAH